ncbi:MAG TPA: DsbA family protein, partial [Solirubrobacterales bacterium]
MLTPPLSAEDHIDGPERAELELVMYGDFQCPYSTAAYPIVRRTRDQLAGRLLFGFRHSPLRDIHPDAERAAEAAEAAAAQVAFWEMHDRLYESNGTLSREDLIGY